MQNTINTNLASWQEETRLTPAESALVGDVSACKLSPEHFSYSLPARALARCHNCSSVVAIATLASGSVVYLDLEIDHQGQARAVLNSPHDCWEKVNAQ